MHAEGLLRHVAFGIEVDVKGLAGRDRVQKLDGADLDDPVPARGIKACRLRIKNDLAH